MRVRALLWLTAIVASILGGVAVYLLLSVPNDLRADSMLKSSRQEIAKGNTAEARESLARIVQQYPRTDAAAAATVALARIADGERAKMQAELDRLRSENQQQSKLLEELRTSVEGVKNAPPKVVTVQAPAPKPKPAPKRTTKRTTPTRRRRR